MKISLNQKFTNCTWDEHNTTKHQYEATTLQLFFQTQELFNNAKLNDDGLFRWLTITITASN